MSSLLHYRPWQGSFRPGIAAIWPIARVALGGLLSRRLFWVLYGFGLLLFLMFFFGNFLLSWALAQAPAAGTPLGDPQRLIRLLQQGLRVLNGSNQTFQYFYAWQAAMVVITLALAGSVMVGNDFTHRSLGFYLAKPIGRWHYLLGKCLAVGAVVLMMTTVPALALFAQRMFEDWDYLLRTDFFGEDGGPSGILLLGGLVGYGMILATVLSVLLVATASWVRSTMPLILVWMSLFFFLRAMANLLVDGFHYDARWRLIDLWNNMALVGQWCLGIEHGRIRPTPQPEFHEALFMLLGVCGACLTYLHRRTGSFEIVR